MSGDSELGLGDAFDPTDGEDMSDFQTEVPEENTQEPEGSTTVDGVEIDYDVPIPETRAGGRGPKWPWPKVKVGGSIRFSNAKTAQSALNSAKRWAQRQPEPKPEFISRSMGDGVYRVFRTQ